MHKDPYYADLSTQKLQQVARTFSDVDKFRDKYFNYDKIFGDDCDSSLKTIDGEPTIKVKFIITDVKSRPNKHVRRYTTRILKKIHKAPKYGLYHSAVVRLTKNLLTRSVLDQRCWNGQKHQFVW